ncbi:DUF6417 family protein [Streptomyces mirabilis]|uniref:DUF6417 family protein n=1 Tax=Streptomyces mirabilis TaxID=68239 RepID=UPI00371CFD35
MSARDAPGRARYSAVCGRTACWLANPNLSQIAALRVFVGLTGRLRVPPADGLAEQVRTASCDHGIKRWRLYLTPEQMESVAYGLWLHRMTGSAAEANRFAREYGVAHSPARPSGEGPPAARGSAGRRARVTWLGWSGQVLRASVSADVNDGLCGGALGILLCFLAQAPAGVLMRRPGSMCAAIACS